MLVLVALLLAVLVLAGIISLPFGGSGTGTRGVPALDAEAGSSSTANPRTPDTAEPVEGPPDEVEGSVKALSIARDLEPGVEDRANATYSYGGVPQAPATRTASRASGRL